MEYTPQGQLHSTGLAGSRVPVFGAAAFRLLGYIAKRSLRWQCMAYAICQRLLSCNGRAESKVPSGLVAFGRALGRIGRFS